MRLRACHWHLHLRHSRRRRRADAAAAAIVTVQRAKERVAAPNRCTAGMRGAMLTLSGRRHDSIRTRLGEATAQRRISLLCALQGRVHPTMVS